MAVQVTKRSGESNDKLIRRFGRLTQRQLKELKDSRFFSKKKTRKRVRDEAIKRNEYRDIRKKEAFM